MSALPGRVRHGLATALAIGWLAPAAWGANLKDVRVGVYADHTRVVLETDTKASFSLNEGEGVVTLSLQASGRPQAVAAKGPHLAWVRVEPSGSATTVKLELRGQARVKQMVLTGPPRIVLDVFSAPGGAAPSAQPAKATPVAKAPEPAKPAPPPKPVAIDDEEALLAEADQVLGPASKPKPDEIAAAEGAPEAEAPASAGPAEASPPAEAAPPVAQSETEAAPTPPAEPAPAPVRIVRKERPGGVLSWLGQPLVWLILAIVALALFFILRRRGSARPEAVAATEEVGSLFGREAHEEAPPESTEPLAAETQAEPPSYEPAPTAADASSFSFDEPDPEPPPRPGSTIGAALASAGVAFDAAPPATNGVEAESLADRLAHFEAQIQELIHSKERLERQVAAQTEELRVQRAAIARTQRVLRTVVRPEEEASEPVPKP